MEEREKLNIKYRWRFLKTIILMHICARAHLFVLILSFTYVLSSNYFKNKRISRQKDASLVEGLNFPQKQKKNSFQFLKLKELFSKKRKFEFNCRL
jgi:hypothetical protein